MSSAVQSVRIPYAPRKWALKMHNSYRRWAALVLHRRAGKTTAILNHHQRAAMDDEWEMQRLRFLLPDAPEASLRKLMSHRVYWHVMPTLKQAKLVAWDMLKRFCEPIPGTRVNNSDLEVTYPTGHKLRLIGADDPDSLRGPALSGVSLDEYSQIPARTFGEVISKALADHLGYAIFGGTIKGKDQLFEMYEAAKLSPDWYAVWQNIDVSLDTESGPTITTLSRALEDDRKLVREGAMTQADFDQEWYLSLEAAIKGSYYADQLREAREQGRICAVPYNPSLLVDTDWDLGVDAMAIWFSQSERGGAIRVIDYYEDVGGAMPAAIKAVKAKPYVYGKHWGPHDIETTEIASGLTRRQTAAAMGLPFEVTPKLSVDEGINAVQLLLPRCWFDAEKCDVGLGRLRAYRKRYNAVLDVFTAEPVHDAASHGSDAFRGLAVRQRVPREAKRRPVVPVYGGWMAQ